MNIIYFLLPLALGLGLGFAGSFLYFVWKGQFDDLETPAHRAILDDDFYFDNEKLMKGKFK